MDWKKIGSSYTPALESRELNSPTTNRHISFEERDEKPPKYERLKYIVGVDDELQDILLDKLENTNRSDRKTKIEDEGLNNRYYDLNLLDYDTPANRNKRKVIDRNTSFAIKLNHTIGVPYSIDIDRYIVQDTPSQPRCASVWSSLSINDWLSYMKLKSDELLKIIHRDKLDIPEWLLRELTNEELSRLYIQNVEILQRLSGQLNSSALSWYDNPDSTAVAYYFVIILYYKILVMPEFDILKQTAKWLVSWSNDYLRINDIVFKITSNIHYKVSLEPLFWQFISGLLLKSTLSFKWFNKILFYLYNYLCSNISSSTDNCELSLVILLSECYIPRLLGMGHVNVIVNTVRDWISSNLHDDVDPSTLFDLSKSQYLIDTFSVETSQVLNELCRNIETLISEQLSAALSEDNTLEFNCLNIEWSEVTIKGIKFNNITIFDEFIYRVLELFGCNSIVRLSSNDRWYNFVKSTVIKTRESQAFLVLMLSHLVFSTLKLEYLILLLEVCNDNRISKLIVQLYYDEPLLWSKYISLLASVDFKTAECMFKDIINAFPKFIPLYGYWLYYMIVNDGDTLEIHKIIEDVGGVLSVDYNNIDWACLVDDKTGMTNLLAVAIGWLYRSMDDISMRELYQLVLLLNEVELFYFANVSLKLIAGKCMSLFDCMLSRFPDNEDLILLYVKYALSRNASNTLKKWLSAEIMYPFTSRVSRQLSLLLNFNYKRNNLYDKCSIKLSILSKLKISSNNIIELLNDNMPMSIPMINFIEHLISTNPHIIQNVIPVIKNSAPFSKRLWMGALFAIEQLTTSKESLINDIHNFIGKMDVNIRS